MEREAVGGSEHLRVQDARGSKLPESILPRTRAEERPAGGVAVGKRATLATLAEAATLRPLGIAQLGQRGGVGGASLHLGGDHRGDLHQFVE